ncbi:transcriptional regulator LytR [Salibacterium salarium]|uniref:Transcriptional regulator LytR n=1 Tax=Salibacterium salarium TaxID=284579 RepID=A0A428N354_9BACI|nr:LCP family protein [Salibacterium salarium]RSL32722.1 transcriptional regulator LytR [Salibacterium salarium]
MWKTSLAIFITVLLITLIAGAGYAYYLYELTSENVQKMNEQYNEEIGPGNEESSQSSLEGSVSFLILGIGGRPDGNDLADTIMGISVNPDDKSVFIFNIPRDTKVSIPGHGEEKINHAYSYGGTSLIKETAEQQLDHSFDFVVETNMEGFTQIVDLVGGIQVDNPFAFSQDNVDHSETYHYKKGPIELNGERALEYVRMRKSDPRGDLGRNERQQQVLTALLQESRSMENLLQGQSVLSILEQNVKTNTTMEDIRTLFTDYRSALDYVQTFEIHGENDYQNGISYYIVSDAGWHEAALRLQNHQEK